MEGPTGCALHEVESLWNIRAKQTWDLTCTLKVSLLLLWKGDIERKLSYIIIWGLQGISKDYFHFLFILNKNMPLRYRWQGKDTIIGVAATPPWIPQSQRKAVTIVLLPWG